MFRKISLFLAVVSIMFICVSPGFSDNVQEKKVKTMRSIVTSDSILSGMIAALLPPHRYSVESILPPGQCPGHYDVKLSDIEKAKKADLIVTFRGMSFLDKDVMGGKSQLLVDAGDRNWMAPNSYIYGLGHLAGELSKRFPKEKNEIMKRKEDAIHNVKARANLLIKKVKQAGVSGKPIICSTMQREPIEWMGFRVVGEYGRPEAISAKDVVRLSKIGKDQNAIAIVDNLQSGPDTGKGIAETLGVPHIVLTNSLQES